MTNKNKKVCEFFSYDDMAGGYEYTAEELKREFPKAYEQMTEIRSVEIVLKRTRENFLEEPTQEELIQSACENGTLGFFKKGGRILIVTQLDYNFNGPNSVFQKTQDDGWEYVGYARDE